MSRNATFHVKCLGTNWGAFNFRPSLLSDRNLFLFLINLLTRPNFLEKIDFIAFVVRQKKRTRKSKKNRSELISKPTIFADRVT